MKLYHYTSKRNAKKILLEGFRTAEKDTYIPNSVSLTNKRSGWMGEVVLTIELNVPDTDILRVALYAKPKADELSAEEFITEQTKTNMDVGKAIYNYAIENGYKVIAVRGMPSGIGTEYAVLDTSTINVIDIYPEIPSLRKLLKQGIKKADSEQYNFKVHFFSVKEEDKYTIAANAKDAIGHIISRILKRDGKFTFANKVYTLNQQKLLINKALLAYSKGELRVTNYGKPPEKKADTVERFWTGGAFWDRLDIFLQRSIEVTIIGMRKKGLQEEEVIEKLVKSFYIEDYEAEWLLKNKFPIGTKLSNYADEFTERYNKLKMADITATNQMSEEAEDAFLSIAWGLNELPDFQGINISLLKKALEEIFLVGPGLSGELDIIGLMEANGYNSAGGWPENEAFFTEIGVTKEEFDAIDEEATRQASKTAEGPHTDKLPDEQERIITYAKELLAKNKPEYIHEVHQALVDAVWHTKSDRAYWLTEEGGMSDVLFQVGTELEKEYYPEIQDYQRREFGGRMAYNPFNKEVPSNFAEYKEYILTAISQDISFDYESDIWFSTIEPIISEAWSNIEFELESNPVKDYTEFHNDFWGYIHDTIIDILYALKVEDVEGETDKAMSTLDPYKKSSKTATDSNLAINWQKSSPSTIAFFKDLGLQGNSYEDASIETGEGEEIWYAKVDGERYLIDMDNSTFRKASITATDSNLTMVWRIPPQSTITWLENIGLNGMRYEESFMESHDGEELWYVRVDGERYLVDPQGSFKKANKSADSKWTVVSVYDNDKEGEAEAKAEWKELRRSGYEAKMEWTDGKVKVLKGDKLTKVESKTAEDESTSFLVHVVDGDQEGIIKIYMGERGWQEKVEEGDIYPSGKTYMSYLTKDEILSWLRKDYDEVSEIHEDDEDIDASKSYMNKMVSDFQKDASSIGRDINSMSEFKAWLKAASPSIEVGKTYIDNSEGYYFTVDEIENDSVKVTDKYNEKDDFSIAALETLVEQGHLEEKVANKTAAKITILKNSYSGEFRVPGPAGTEAQAYYTEDKDDAIGTAKHMHGEDVQIGFRTVPDFDRYTNMPVESNVTEEDIKEAFASLDKAQTIVNEGLEKAEDLTEAIKAFQMQAKDASSIEEFRVWARKNNIITAETEDDIRNYMEKAKQAPGTWVDVYNQGGDYGTIKYLGDGMWESAHGGVEDGGWERSYEVSEEELLSSYGIYPEGITMEQSEDSFGKEESMEEETDHDMASLTASMLSPEELKIKLEIAAKRKVAEEGGPRWSVLSSGSRVNTKNPMKNEFIAGWQEQQNTYYLIETDKYRHPVIISSSGSPEVSEGGEVNLFDDYNGTTRFPKQMSGPRGQYRNWPAKGRILAVATSAEEITTNFPQGTYSLMVLK